MYSYIHTYTYLCTPTAYRDMFIYLTYSNTCLPKHTRVLTHTHTHSHIHTCQTSYLYAQIQNTYGHTITAKHLYTYHLTSNIHQSTHMHKRPQTYAIRYTHIDAHAVTHINTHMYAHACKQFLLDASSYKTHIPTDTHTYAHTFIDAHKHTH